MFFLNPVLDVSPIHNNIIYITNINTLLDDFSPNVKLVCFNTLS